MSKSVYVRVFHGLELLRYVLRCATGRQLQFPSGMNMKYIIIVNILIFGLIPFFKLTKAEFIQQLKG